MTKELGPGSSPGRQSAPQAEKVSRREWWFVALLSAIAIAVTTVPVAVALVLASIHGQRWTGLQSLSPGDLSVYLSYIAQVKHGAVLLKDWYTTEPVIPSFNTLWFLVGMLAKATGASPLLAFHLARILLIPALAASAYALLAHFFTDVRSRKIGAILFLFSSGLGALLGGVFSGAASGEGTYQRPIDLWVGESNAFLTMGYSPHFIASLALILLCVLFFLRAIDRQRLREAVIAGILGLVLFQFHPFHAPTLLAVFFAYLFRRAVVRELKLKDAFAFVTFAAIASPAIAYHYWLTHADPVAKALLVANLCLTPSVWHVLIGLGVLVPLAVWGAVLARRGAEPRRWDFLAIWAAVQFVLLYSPLTFQRRLTEGLQFPLVALSVPAVLACVAAVRKMRGRKRDVVLPLLSIIAATALFSSSFSSVATNIALYQTNRPPLFYFPSYEADALDWLRDRAPDDGVVFGAFDTGNRVAGWGERPTYAGHWVNTIDIVRKNAEVSWFFARANDVARRQYALDHGISAIYFGPKERAFGGAAPGNGFLRVYRNPSVTIYRVLP
jgi:hypothetical protein